MNISAGMPQINLDRQQRLDSFAEYVSVLPWFNVNILHKLYTNIYRPNESNLNTYDIRAITCADLIHSPYVDRVSYNVFVIQPVLQDELRIKIQLKQDVMIRLGEFMIAYAMDCRKHFLGPKYIESYRIEGNLILNPLQEANRITTHIVAKINQIKDFGQKKNSVSYYLNLLQKNTASPQQEELVKFLKGYQEYNKQSQEIPEEWKLLKDRTKVTGETISIRIPKQVREVILKQISDYQIPRAHETLHTLLIGIDEYTHSNIFPLHSAVADANFIEAFVERNQVENKEYQTTKLFSTNATRDNIVTALESIGQKAKGGDTFLFYFAGYGGVEQQDMVTQNSNSGNFDNENEMLRFLVCYDTTFHQYGLALIELEYLLSKFPKSCTCIIILDCSFQRNSRIKRSNAQKIRSIPWLEPPRLKKGFVWSTEMDDFKSNDSFNGIMLYASASTDNAYESNDHGNFTFALIEGLTNRNNEVSYTELFSEPNSMQFESTDQSPRLETKGNFSPTHHFLKGFLKIKSQWFIAFFIESNIDPNNIITQLKIATNESISQKKSVFSLTENKSKAGYVIKSEDGAIGIYHNDELRRPVTGSLVCQPEAIPILIQYMRHIANWEYIRTARYSRLIALNHPVDINIYSIQPDGSEKKVELKDDTFEFNFEKDKKETLLGKLKVQIINNSSAMIYCSLLYLSNRFEVYVNVIDGKVISLKPGEATWIQIKEVIPLQVEQHNMDLNYPYNPFYLKLMANIDPFEVDQLEQSYLNPSRENKNKVESNFAIPPELKTADVQPEQVSHLFTRTICFKGQNPYYTASGASNVLDRIQKAKDEELTDLNLSSLQLTDLPKELFELTSLITLDISRNQLTKIPQGIGQLSKLEVLAAHENIIIEVHEDIGKLQNLHTLLLYKCKLTKFPTGILNLIGLKNLQLEGNEIKWIPVRVKDYPNLEQIDIRNNPILNIPLNLHVCGSHNLKLYYNEYQPYPESDPPLIMNVYLPTERDTAANVEQEDFSLMDEKIVKALSNVHFRTKRIGNPDGEYLFNRLYQCQHNLTILHLVANNLTKIKSPRLTWHSITADDLSEMFSCVREMKFRAILVILNYSNAQLHAPRLTENNFNLVFGMEATSFEAATEFNKALYSGVAVGQSILEVWETGMTDSTQLPYKLYSANDTTANESMSWRLKEPKVLLIELVNANFELTNSSDYIKRNEHTTEIGKLIADIIKRNNLSRNDLLNGDPSEKMFLAIAYSVLFNPGEDSIPIINRIALITSHLFTKYTILETYKKLINENIISQRETYEILNIIRRYYKDSDSQLAEKSHEIKTLLKRLSYNA